MAEQAVWHLKRVTLPIPVPSVAALRARAWMVGPPLLLGLLAALIAVAVQTTTWRSKTEVLLTTTIVAKRPVSVPIPGTIGEDPRTLEWQASLARSPDLAVRVVRAAGVHGLTAAQFLRHSSAKASARGSEGFLTLSVTYRQRTAAVRLTNAYATEFVRFKNDVDKRNLREAALRANRGVIKGLRANGLTGIPAFKELLQKQRDLRSGRVSPLSGVAAQVRADATTMRADGATSVRPHTLRNGILGGLIGAMLGLVLLAAVTKLRPR